MTVKIHKSVKRTYTVGPYETIHIESSIEREVEADKVEEAKKALAAEVVKDFKDYREVVFLDIEDDNKYQNHSSDMTDVRDKFKEKDEEFQDSFLQD